MIAAQITEKRQDEHFVIRPNRSLSWRGAQIFFSAAAIVTLTVAIMFAMKGAWLILPFAGLEILALGACLYICARKNTECEVIHISDEFVRVERGRRYANQCVEFRRHWLQVNLTRNKLSWYPSRLTIGSMGREIEIGASLLDEERATLAQALQYKLAN